MLGLHHTSQLSGLHAGCMFEVRSLRRSSTSILQMQEPEQHELVVFLRIHVLGSIHVFINATVMISLPLKETERRDKSIDKLLESQRADRFGKKQVDYSPNVFHETLIGQTMRTCPRIGRVATQVSNTRSQLELAGLKEKGFGGSRLWMESLDEFGLS